MAYQIDRAVIALRVLRAAAGLAVLLALVPPWLALRRWPRARRRLEVLGWRILLGSFGISVRSRGEPLRTTGRLFAANHVSWTDIALLGGLIDAGFVAKSEVADWPFLGPLARAYGCRFVERARRSAASAQAASLAESLGRGNCLILFPEGTTGDGIALLPFNSSLFAAFDLAREEGVQPVTIRYGDADGRALTPERGFAWLGEEALLPHALRIAAMPPVIAEVWFEEPVTGSDRKELARQCQAAIAARLDQAATRKRWA